MMNVRELITSLLDYDMDATVEIRVESKEDSFDTNEFQMEEFTFSFSKYVTLKIKPDGHVVVDESDYIDLKDEKYQLDSLAEELKENIQTLNEEIYALEQQK